jgi:hypothetical protein
MEKLLMALARMREWKDEYAKRYEASMPDAEKYHAVAMEMFSDLEEYFIGAEKDFQQFEAMLKGAEAEQEFCLRQAERVTFCYAQGDIDLLVEETDGVHHDSLHLPVLNEYVGDGLRCLKQYNELPDHAQKFVENAVTSIIRDQFTYWHPQYVGRCHCEACERDRKQAEEILAETK